MTVPPLPARCEKCGAVLWLRGQPVQWCDENGRAHACEEKP